MILGYLNKQYKILCNENQQYHSMDFKISKLCYKKNCINKKLCNSCIELVYWNKLLNIIDKR